MRTRQKASHLEIHGVVRQPGKSRTRVSARQLRNQTMKLRLRRRRSCRGRRDVCLEWQTSRCRTFCSSFTTLKKWGKEFWPVFILCDTYVRIVDIRSWKSLSTISREIPENRGGGKYAYESSTKSLLFLSKKVEKEHGINWNKIEHYHVALFSLSKTMYRYTYLGPEQTWNARKLLNEENAG